MDFNLVGVQTERDADNLRRALMQELGAVAEKLDVLAVGRKGTRVKSFPIGIDASDFQEVAARPRSNRIVRWAEPGSSDCQIIESEDQCSETDNRRSAP
jgi:trehalose 6-phosphate synthase